MFAARCLSERLWGSAGASEPPPSLHGEKGRKEEVSLGEWLAPCLIMLWLYLEGESEAASKRSALLSSLHRGAEREGVWLFFQQTAWFCWRFLLSTSFLVVSGPNSLLGYLCCFQDCHLRRASGLWCY